MDILSRSLLNTEPASSLPVSLDIHNIQEIVQGADGDGFRLCRMPTKFLSNLNDGAKRRAWSPAGAEIRFNLVGPEARVVLKIVEDRAGEAQGLPVLAEIYYGDYFVRWVKIESEWTEITIRPPENREALHAASKGNRFDPTLVRLVLPYMPEVRLQSVTGEITPPRSEQLPARRFLAYGSSITNGAFAVRPGDTYPARIARAFGVDHFNLGFGGGAHLEPELSAWIAERNDWEFATLEMGINLLNILSPAEFAERVECFLPPIAEAHSEQWIFCIDLFTCMQDFQGDSKPNEFRKVVRDAVKKLGAPKVVYLDGSQLLTDPSGLTSDLVHPSSNGFSEIGQRLVTEMGKRLTSRAWSPSQKNGRKPRK